MRKHSRHVIDDSARLRIRAENSSQSYLPWWRWPYTSAWTQRNTTVFVSFGHSWRILLEVMTNTDITPKLTLSTTEYDWNWNQYPFTFVWQKAIKGKFINEKNAIENTYSVQCAAVTTHLLLMSDPPQVNLPFRLSKICHGQAPRCARWPPTMYGLILMKFGDRWPHTVRNTQCYIERLVNC